MVVLSDEQNLAIERRVRALERKSRLDLAPVAAAVDRLADPVAMAIRLGPAIRYAQRVEADVAGLSIQTLLPYANGGHIGRFLHVWVPDESGHGDALDLLLERIEVDKYVAASPDAIPPHNRLAGFLGRMSQHAYNIVSMTYHSIGSMNERLAMGAYTQMARTCDELGAGELSRALFVPMRADEALHLGYYRTYALQLRQTLKNWQMAVVRSLIVHTYAPVGAGGKDDKAPFGEVLLLLEDDPENPSIAKAVQEIAQDLLARDGETLPPFVNNQLRHCLDLARAA